MTRHVATHVGASADGAADEHADAVVDEIRRQRFIRELVVAVVGDAEHGCAEQGVGKRELRDQAGLGRQQPPPSGRNGGSRPRRFR